MSKDLTEISKSKLGNYVNSASKRAGEHDYQSGMMGADGISGLEKYHAKLADKRRAGISKAISKLTKENIDEQKDTKQVHHVIVGSKTSKYSGIEDRVFIGQPTKTGHKIHRMEHKAQVFKSKKEADAYIKKLPKDHDVKSEGGLNLGHTFKYKAVPKRDKSSIGSRHDLMKSGDKGEYSKSMDESFDEISELTTEETEWDSNTKSHREVSHYHIISKRDGRIVGKANTKKGARRTVDKRDNEYGSYNHYAKPVFKEETEVSEKTVDLPIKGFNVINKRTGKSIDFIKNKSDAHKARLNVDLEGSNTSDKMDHVVTPSFKLTKIKESNAKPLKDILLKPSKENNEFEGDNDRDKNISKKYDDNTVVHSDANGNDDEVFKASKLKRAEKKYLPGEDEKKYKDWNTSIVKTPVRKV
jgi:hypothetical protein